MVVPCYLAGGVIKSLLFIHHFMIGVEGKYRLSVEMVMKFPASKGAFY